MLEGQAWDRVADKITEADFYRGALAEESSPADVVTVSEWLDKHQELQNAGGLAYLASLANNTPSAANIGAYANIVRERAILRNRSTLPHALPAAPIVRKAKVPRISSISRNAVSSTSASRARTGVAASRPSRRC